MIGTITNKTKKPTKVDIPTQQIDLYMYMYDDE